MSAATASSYALITASAAFAAEAHASQVRRELNEPYIIHPLRCGKMAADFECNAEFIAALHLHDVVEDTRVPMETLQTLFPEHTVNRPGADEVVAESSDRGDDGGEQGRLLPRHHATGRCGAGESHRPHRQHAGFREGRAARSSGTQVGVALSHEDRG
jgi:hypothetical protein